MALATVPGAGFHNWPKGEDSSGTVVYSIDLTISGIEELFSKIRVNRTSEFGSKVADGVVDRSTKEHRPQSCTSAFGLITTAKVRLGELGPVPFRVQPSIDFRRGDSDEAQNSIDAASKSLQKGSVVATTC